MVSWSSVIRGINELLDFDCVRRKVNFQKVPRKFTFLLTEIKLTKPINTMTQKEAQVRISSGLPVYVHIRGGDQQRHQIKSIGLTICHSTTNQRFSNNAVEFSA